jgi:hypothetical protein
LQPGPDMALVPQHGTPLINKKAYHDFRLMVKAAVRSSLRYSK